jgi:hypothetical protein
MAVKGSSRRQPRARMALAVFCAAVFAVVLPAPSFAASAPRIGGESASVSENKATLKADIDPEGLQTIYEFWVRYEVCQSGSGGGCNSVAERVGSGSILASDEAQPVSVELKSLKWNYSYSFVILAANPDGTRESPSVTFETGSAPPVGEGGSGGGAPYKSENERWVGEGAAGSASEAPEREAERAAKHKEEEERPAKEAAERAAQEREIREMGERVGREAAEQERAATKEFAAMCRVPSLKGDSLARARSALSKAHCRLGKVVRSGSGQKGLVIVGQSRRRGTRLTHRAAVAVRLGPRPRAP